MLHRTILNISKEYSRMFLSLLKTTLSILDLGLPVFWSQLFIEFTALGSPSISPLTVPSLQQTCNLMLRHQEYLVFFTQPLRPRLHQGINFKFFLIEKKSNLKIFNFPLIPFLCAFSLVNFLKKTP